VAAGANPILSSTEISQKIRLPSELGVNSSIRLLGSQLILNMFASAQIK